MPNLHAKYHILRLPFQVNLPILTNMFFIYTLIDFTKNVPVRNLTISSNLIHYLLFK